MAIKFSVKDLKAIKFNDILTQMKEGVATLENMIGGEIDSLYVTTTDNSKLVKYGRCDIEFACIKLLSYIKEEPTQSFIAFGANYGDFLSRDLIITGTNY